MDVRLSEIVDYKQIVDSSLDPFWVFDVESRTIIDANESYCTLMGMAKDEVVGRRIEDFDMLDSREDVEHRIEKILKDGSDNFIVTQHTKDGKEIKLEVSARYQESNGRRFIFAFLRDVTEKLTIQKALKESEAKLYQLNTQLLELIKQETQKRVSKELAFESIFEIFGTGLAILDGEGIVVEANGRFRKIFDIDSKEECVGAFFYSFLDEGDSDGLKNELEKIMQRTRDTNCYYDRGKVCKSDEEQQFELSLKLKNQKKISVIVSVSCFKNSHNTVNYIFSFTDTTNIRELENKQKESEKMLVAQSRMAAMGEMIGAIAHQWRQPLNHLGIMIQDVQFCYEAQRMTEEYVEKFVTTAMGQVYFMSKTIDDFRNFFRQDKMAVRFLLSNQVKNSLNLILDMFRSHGVSIDVSVKKDVEVIAYPNELSQVILNIASNAKDSLEAKSELLDKRIVVRIDADDKFAVVEMEDNGGGIDESIIDRVFEPYFTTKPEGRGTGIGLYMSKTIIEDHIGGRLLVENRERGACFIIKIPLPKDAALF